MLLSRCDATGGYKVETARPVNRFVGELSGVIFWLTWSSCKDGGILGCRQALRKM